MKCKEGREKYPLGSNDGRGFGGGATKANEKHNREAYNYKVNGPKPRVLIGVLEQPSDHVVLQKREKTQH